MNEKLKTIELVILDVDGTLTDGGVYLDCNQGEMKKFNVKDGCGIAMARAVGIRFVILTGRESNCVAKRAEELNIDYLFQGVKNKVSFLKEFATEHHINLQKAAYVGDDLNDLLAMELCGVTACPADGVAEVMKCCDYVVKARGGEGAVREFLELLLKEQGLWEVAMEKAFAIGNTYRGASN